MRLEGVELVRAEIPFREEVGTAVGVHRVRTILFVRVAAEGVSGWGECGALAEGTSVDPPVDAVEAAASERGVRRLREASAARDGRLPSAAETAQLFGTRPVDRLLAATFEMAVADLELREAGESLGKSMGLTTGFEAMPVGGFLGIPPDREISTFKRSADLVVARGVTRLRMKIAPGWDLEPVRIVREDHHDLAIQVDANGSYRLEDAEHLGRLAEFGVLCLEQPLPPADLVASAELAKQMTVPVCLDESLSSLHRVRDALRYGSCAVACLKPARLGGLRAARAAHAVCAAAGVPVFVGGFFEAGLGRAANLALAARLSMDAAGLVCDLDDPADYLEVDPCGYPPVVGGWVRVPEEPGVGSAPDQGILDHLGVRRRWFPATYT
jgi:O-succinylbenzoate synthase